MTRPSSVWRAADPLVLASKSNARAALLRAAGFSFSVEPAHLDERLFEENLENEQRRPASLAQNLASEKARLVSIRNPDAWVLGADQTLAIDDVLMHKSDTRDAAHRQIETFSGRTHQLFSAVAVARNARVIWTHFERVDLTMRSLSNEAISIYLDHALPDCLSAVGCYHWETLGRHLFHAVEGRDDVILGLPLDAVIGIFRSAQCLKF